MIRKIFLAVALVFAAASAMAATPAEGDKAPAFTLNNLDGKAVSLESLEGKWLVLDFWGAWCRWCMVGVPQMKEEYAKMSDKVEFVGIDCRDSQETWRNTVKEKEMNWTQLYAPEDSDILALYGVRGFPTKIVVDPKGVIRKICVGEDPEFYSQLSALIND